jgi:guanylate kinase
MRRGDVDGVTYRFVTPEAFEAERSDGGFLESFEVDGNLYGTPRRPVEDHLAAGSTVVLEIDVQGALAVRAAVPDALLVLIAPPSPAVLRARLLGRNDGMDPEKLEARLAAAEAELAHRDRFDAVVVNDALDAAVTEIATLVERRRTSSDLFTEH